MQDSRPTQHKSENAASHADKTGHRRGMFIKKTFTTALPAVLALGTIYSAAAGNGLSCAICAAALVLLLALWLAAGVFFIRLAIVRGGVSNIPASAFDPEKIPAFPVHKAAMQWLRDMQPEATEIESRDGLKLRGYYLKSNRPSGRLAILAHGYSGKGPEMAVYAQIYYNLGFDVFAPDCRAHGESDGKYIGMGWLDRLDYLMWLDFLITRGHGADGIILHGESMGAAAVSILSGEKLPPNVRGIVSDCGYDSVKNEFTAQIGNMFKLPAFPIIPITSLLCRLRAGYFFGEGNAAAQVAKCRVPILFIHGEADRFVPFSMVHSLYSAADPALRSLWTVPNAGHAGAVEVEPEMYAAKVKEFVGKVFAD